MNRDDAQQRTDEIRLFRTEMERLEREGVLRLDEAQRQRVAAHHDGVLGELARTFDIDANAQAKRLSLGMRVASFIGALALGASVFFLFYQFWGLFPAAAQIAILIAASCISLAATWLIQRRDATGYFTKLGAMVAFACFVLNVVMLGQIFNITPSDKALLPWAAVAFLLAYVCELRLLLAVGILCVIAFVSARTGTWSGMYWIHFGQRPENFLPAGLLIFAAGQLIDHRRFAGFAPIYRVFGLLAIVMPMLVLANWGRHSYLPMAPAIVEGFYQLAGMGVCAAAIAYGARRGWSDVVNTGLTLFVIFLYTKMFDWWWEIMPKYLFFLVLGMVAILLLLVFRRLRAGFVRMERAP